MNQQKGLQMEAFFLSGERAYLTVTRANLRLPT